LLRGAEARAPQAPPIGTAKLPADDVVTLVHSPSLAFPAATLAAISVEGERAVVEGIGWG
jgi:type VI secretion system protein ImpH